MLCSIDCDLAVARSGSIAIARKFGIFPLHGNRRSGRLQAPTSRMVDLLC